MAVDETSCALVSVPEIRGRYYTAQFLNGWGETVANINAGGRRVIAEWPNATAHADDRRLNPVLASDGAPRPRWYRALRCMLSCEG